MKDQKKAANEQHIKKQTIKPFLYSEKWKKYQWQYWMEWYRYKYHKKKVWLIQMFMPNDTIDTFTVSTAGEVFERFGDKYYIDPDMAVHDTRSRYPMLTYYKNVAAPIKIRFDMDDISKKLDKVDEGLKQTLNPKNFRRFFDSTVIEKLLSASELNDKMKMMQMLLIGTLILSAISVLILVQYTGILG